MTTRSQVLVLSPALKHLALDEALDLVIREQQLRL